tara:strand:+ start:870 stop:1760 length:891 start_codon:yes stop_codon:yes gene_type:complete
VTTPLPPVSIGISFFNAEVSLLDAVRSVFAQTHQNWELILIDDGSTDRSLELAKSINDPRVKVYSDGQNKKLAARLNEIIDLASFDFIARMDADDLMARDRIEKELRVLASDPACDLVSTGVVSLTDDNQPVGVRCVHPSHVVTPRSLLRTHHGIVHASIVARKDWYQRNRYREDLPCSEDKSLWISAYSRSDLNVRFLAEPLYYYREDSSASSFKLLRAYRVGRGIIARDAKNGFPFPDKASSYIRSALQSLVVSILDRFNKMDLIRARRSVGEMLEEDRQYFENEIAAIKGRSE